VEDEEEEDESAFDNEWTNNNEENRAKRMIQPKNAAFQGKTCVINDISFMTLHAE